MELASGQQLRQLLPHSRQNFTQRDVAIYRIGIATPTPSAKSSSRISIQ